MSVAVREALVVAAFPAKPIECELVTEPDAVDAAPWASRALRTWPGARPLHDCVAAGSVVADAAHSAKGYRSAAPVPQMVQTVEAAPERLLWRLDPASSVGRKEQAADAMLCRRPVAAALDEIQGWDAPGVQPMYRIPPWAHPTHRRRVQPIQLLARRWGRRTAAAPVGPAGPVRLRAAVRMQCLGEQARVAMVQMRLFAAATSVTADVCNGSGAGAPAAALASSVGGGDTTASCASCASSPS